MESCYDLENKVLTLGEVRNFMKMLEEKMQIGSRSIEISTLHRHVRLIFR